MRSSSSANIVKIAKKQFNKVINDQTPKDKTSVKSFDDIIKHGSESLLEEQILGATEFINKFRIDPNGKGVMFVNGKYFDMDDVSIISINRSKSFIYIFTSSIDLLL